MSSTSDGHTVLGLSCLWKLSIYINEIVQKKKNNNNEILKIIRITHVGIKQKMSENQ